MPGDRQLEHEPRAAPRGSGGDSSPVRLRNPAGDGQTPAVEAPAGARPPGEVRHRRRQARAVVGDLDAHRIRPGVRADLDQPSPCSMAL